VRASRARRAVDTTRREVNARVQSPAAAKNADARTDAPLAKTLDRHGRIGKEAMTRRRAAGRFRTVAVLTAVAVVACAGGQRSGQASSVERRGFAVPGHGVLELGVPPGWKAVEGGGDEPGQATIELAPSDRAFVVLLTPFWNPADEKGGATVETAQVLAEMARRKALEGAEEKEIPLMELVGERGVHGFWFAASDRNLAGKAPAKEEYRHLLQGAAVVGRLLLAFTLLDNGPGPQRDAALDVVRTARHLPGADEAGTAEGEGDGERGFELDAGAQTVPLVVSRPERRVTILVDLPGFRVFKPRSGADGQSLLVLGQDPESGIVASILLRDGAGMDARACRADALARIRRAVPDLVAVRESEAGGAARVEYALEELHGRRVHQVHAHAFLAREGVCVNLHLSKAAPAPEDAARFEKILASLRFGESL
jgi:hypothetical protein